jgi:hypothetical protein
MFSVLFCNPKNLSKLLNSNHQMISVNIKYFTIIKGYLSINLLEFNGFQILTNLSVYTLIIILKFFKLYKIKKKTIKLVKLSKEYFVKKNAFFTPETY